LSGGTVRAAQDAVTFIFPEGAFQWNPATGELEPQSLLEGRFFLDMAMAAEGERFSFRDWVTWRKAYSSKPYDQHLIEDEIEPFVTLDTSGQSGLAVGHRDYHLVTRNNSKLTSTPIAKSSGVALSAARDGTHVWVLCAHGLIERL